MNNIENQLKDLIKERYGTVSEFSRTTGIPNSTINSVLSRGIGTATGNNLRIICEALKISSDALINGKIETAYKDDSTDLNEILDRTRKQLLTTKALMFNGKPADEDSIQAILDAMEVGMELARRRSEKK